MEANPMLSTEQLSVHLKERDTIISGMDPLSADTLMTKVPVLNRNQDVNGLADLLKTLLPPLPTLKTFSYNQAAAAMRDIGFLLGSIKRHGQEPVPMVDGLAEALHLLGEKLHLPPRDTLISYTVWNPQGRRLRTYTGTADEMNLIYSVQLAMYPLENAILQLRNLYFLPLESPAFRDTCREVTHLFSMMVKGVVHAKRFVSPMEFATSLRFYFDPIEIEGKVYLGPGAVEMPVFVFDHILWSSDVSDPQYVEFKETYLPYIIPELQDIYKDFEGRPSLLTIIRQKLTAEKIADPEIIENLKQVKALLQQLKSFRMPHKKLAEDAYYKSGKAERSKGSGGYAPTMLQFIIDLNVERMNLFSEAVEKYRKNAPIAV